MIFTSTIAKTRLLFELFKIQRPLNYMDQEVGDQGDYRGWHCRSCSSVFETRGKRNAHQRRVHQTLTTTAVLGVSSTLVRCQDGAFRCTCGKGYPSAQSLMRHQKKCELAADVLGAQLIEEEGTRHGLHTINVSTAS